MNIHEFGDCMSEMGRHFEKFSGNAKETGEAWREKWWRNLRSFSKEVFVGALEKYTDIHRREPTIGELKPFLYEESKRREEKKNNSTSKLGLPKTETITKETEEFYKTSKLEFCMDVLGHELVNEEIRKLNPVMDKGILDRCPPWVHKYKDKLNEIFETAKNFDPELYKRRFR